MNSFQRAAHLTRTGIIALMILLFLLFAVRGANAFALLGPYTDWMSETNGYQQDGDIGGPMNLGEEYRWDVPTITYAFDQSFVDYFGSNGVAAVEGAIQILNDFPAASELVLSDYPASTLHSNARAAALSVYDLKSTALALMLEQLGLTQPTRNILALHGWDPALLQAHTCGDSACPALTTFSNLVVQRNFDPATLQPSFMVNGTAYTGFFSTNASPPLNLISEYPQDPSQSIHTAVADAFSFSYAGLQRGDFYTGLTRDDAGGLAYLLHATNVNWESLPKNVIFTGPDHEADKHSRGTWRPGVEKITFAPQPRNKRGKFKTAVFKFTAYRATNGVATPQAAERIVSGPDIIFSAADTFPIDSLSPLFVRTGTSRWANNARQNGNPDGAGPGTIIPPVRITFNELGPRILSGGPFNPPEVINQSWASFDESTNPPVVYPPNTGQKDLFVWLHFFDTKSTPPLQIKATVFHAPVPFGGSADLQISTNRNEWISLVTVTNAGADIRWDYLGPKIPISFRVLPASQ